MKTGIDRQISAYLSGGLSDLETKELLKWVADDPKHAEHFARCCTLDEFCHELAAENQLERSVAAKKSHFFIQPILGWAAAIILILGCLYFKPWGPSQDTFAIVSQVVGAAGPDGIPIPSGHRFGAEAIELQKGLIRIDFDHGASITLEGPAFVEIKNSMHAFFHYGVATFQVPEAAKGFTVDTVNADVVDLGTAFGLSRQPEGDTDVCVFEGEVEVNGQLVQEGQAVRADATSTIERRSFETEPYENAWPLTSGVLQTTGMMKFVPPGPGFVPGAYEDSEHITVFLEQRKVTLSNDLHVDLADPGEFRKIRHDQGPVLLKGTRVRSYLLQLDPVGQLPKLDPAKSRVQGQITFDQPILGLLASNDKLLATDQSLGHTKADYGKLPRGVEPPKPKLPNAEGRDVVILAADQRTLTLNIAAGSAVDQIRVLVSD